MFPNPRNPFEMFVTGIIALHAVMFMLGNYFFFSGYAILGYITFFLIEGLIIYFSTKFVNRELI